jgi:hypothetical protein
MFLDIITIYTSLLFSVNISHQTSGFPQACSRAGQQAWWSKDSHARTTPGSWRFRVVGHRVRYADGAQRVIAQAIEFGINAGLACADDVAVDGARVERLSGDYRTCWCLHQIEARSFVQP